MIGYCEDYSPYNLRTLVGASVGCFFGAHLITMLIWGSSYRDTRCSRRRRRKREKLEEGAVSLGPRTNSGSEHTDLMKTPTGLHTGSAFEIDSAASCVELEGKRVSLTGAAGGQLR